jgi:probable O-glycosylation ligase (exosortase A-associated)
MRDLIVTAIVFGSLPWILSRPYIGIFVWYWLGLMNAHRACYGFAYSFPFAQIVAITTLGSILFTKDKKSVPWDTSLVLLMLLYAHMAVTSATAWIPEAAWSKWIDFGKIVLVTVVMTTVIYGRERIRMLMLVSALSVGFYGFKGGIFTILTGGSYRVWGPPGNTFISGNNEIGLALTMVIPFIIALGKEERRKWLRLSLFFTAFLSSIATVFTYSRGAMLALGTAFSLMFIKSNKKYLLIPLIIPIVIFGKSLLPDSLNERTATIGSYEQDMSAMQRVRAWKVAWRIALESPLLGAGFDFEDEQTYLRWMSYTDPDDEWLGSDIHVAHSIYFQALGQHGFVGLALFLAILCSSLVKAKSLSRRAKLHQEIQWIDNYAAAIYTSLVGFMVAGAFLNKAWFDLIWLYVGLLAILEREMIPTTIPVNSMVKNQPKEKAFVRSPKHSPLRE